MGESARRKQAEQLSAEAPLLQEALNKGGIAASRGLPLLEAGRSHSSAQAPARSGSPPGCGRPTRPGTSAQRLPGRQARTAAEQVRAARPGGLIWRAAWPAAPLPLAAPFRHPATAARCRTSGWQARAEGHLQHSVLSLCIYVRDKRQASPLCGCLGSPMSLFCACIKCKTAVARPRQSASLQRQAGPPRGINQRAQGMQGMEQPRILCLVLATPSQAVVLQYKQMQDRRHSEPQCRYRGRKVGRTPTRPDSASYSVRRPKYRKRVTVAQCVTCLDSCARMQTSLQTREMELTVRSQQLSTW